MQFLFTRQHLPGHLDKAAVLSHSGTLGYRYTGEFCTADDETSININRRRWSVGSPLYVHGEDVFHRRSNRTNLITLRCSFLGIPPFSKTLQREREASVNGVVKRVERKGDASDMWMRERERGINKKREKKRKKRRRERRKVARGKMVVEDPLPPCVRRTSLNTNER